MVSVDQWTTTEVGAWLAENGFSSYVDLFCTNHRMDGPALLTLTEADLKSPPMQIKVLGDIKRLVLVLHKLQLEHGGAIRQMPTLRSSNAARPEIFFNRIDSNASTVSDDQADAPVRVSGRLSRCLEPEYVKCLISFVYMFAVFLLTAFVMVIVHDRVPDMKKYPPLPDIVLDNLPYIPWAFEICELAGVILFSIWSMTLFFHKHR